VEEVRRPTLLRLRAEMRVPGRAWLEWRLTPTADGLGTEVRQLARFDPRGLWGRVYWLGVLPFHRFVFPGLLDGLARDAANAASRATTDAESAMIGPQ
jgi:hypothetical protein